MPGEIAFPRAKGDEQRGEVLGAQVRRARGGASLQTNSRRLQVKNPLPFMAPC
jgi:hypothetical protein